MRGKIGAPVVDDKHARLEGRPRHASVVVALLVEGEERRTNWSKGCDIVPGGHPRPHPAATWGRVDHTVVESVRARRPRQERRDLVGRDRRQLHEKSASAPLALALRPDPAAGVTGDDALCIVNICVHG